MTWSITYAGNTVTLPVTGLPDKVAKKGPAFIKEIDIPGDALILSFGNKAIVMTWTGILAEGTKTCQQLYNDYFNALTNKLDAFKHQEVTLGGGTPGYVKGPNPDWILQNIQYDARKGVTTAFWYTFTFIQGGDHIVI